MHVVVTNPGQVAEVIRGRRKARGLHQQQVATQLHISQSRLSALEAGPSALTLERLIRLANVLGLQVVLQDMPEQPGPTQSAEHAPAAAAAE
jgi:HTH-type transcriptional regulator/antitoxin HipB